MGRMSDLDLTLRGLSDDIRVRPWSMPTLSIVVDDAGLKRSMPELWRGVVCRWITVELWCMPPSVWMGEEST